MGYSRLVGIDISEGMLARASARGVYSDLRNRALGEKLDFEDKSFTAIVSTGVFTDGHAPPSAFEELLRITRPGGHLIFSIGKGAWESGGFREKLEGMEAARHCRPLVITEPYAPMPFSGTLATTTARMFVYEVL
jgi:ubiquinone/menaquinone biosynthesis C-methylase UbiE